VEIAGFAAMIGLTRQCGEDTVVEYFGNGIYEVEPTHPSI